MYRIDEIKYIIDTEKDYSRNFGYIALKCLDKPIINMNPHSFEVILVDVDTNISYTKTVQEVASLMKEDQIFGIYYHESGAVMASMISEKGYHLSQCIKYIGLAWHVESGTYALSEDIRAKINDIASSVVFLDNLTYIFDDYGIENMQAFKLFNQLESSSWFQSDDATFTAGKPASKKTLSVNSNLYDRMLLHKDRFIFLDDGTLGFVRVYMNGGIRNIVLQRFHYTPKLLLEIL